MGELRYQSELNELCRVAISAARTDRCTTAYQLFQRALHIEETGGGVMSKRVANKVRRYIGACRRRVARS